MDRSVERVRLIRSGGHLLKGGYDVHTDGRHLQESASAPAVRCSAAQKLTIIPIRAIRGARIPKTLFAFAAF